jgi:transposase
VSDLFGVSGRALLERLEIPEPWRWHVDASLVLINDLDRRIAGIERELERSGADHRFVPLLLSVPGIGWVLAYTIAAEIDSGPRRSISPDCLTRGPRPLQPTSLTATSRAVTPRCKHGPAYLRWALIEAAMHPFLAA